MSAFRFSHGLCGLTENRGEMAGKREYLTEECIPNLAMDNKVTLNQKTIILCHLVMILPLKEAIKTC